MKPNSLVLKILVVVPESLGVDLQFGSLPGSLIEKLPGIGQLMLVHALDVGHFSGDHLLGALHLPGEPGVLGLEVAHLVNVACQPVIQVLQVLLLLEPGVTRGA